ncbi:MAG TPA: 1,2-phenylacetyl-CoA epoxidase subunit PaaD [Gemmatimonadaceae bacterium]|nr:1,2-phenylacetyl-CoA epoxidase subunit PaaD [Gemmatimonadaceae bacterium]
MVSRAVSFTRAELMAVLDEVKDPEVPVLSVVELGVVRDVEVLDDGVRVTVTPTYSGCPAMAAIEHDIAHALRAHGVANVQVRTSYLPAWTTDWIPAAAREKLRAYGIAPPGPADHEAPVQIGRRRAAVRCPFCGSPHTQLRSEFGSTACKAIHVCDECRQPFEEFKAI